MADSGFGAIRLHDRGIVSVTGVDAVSFLDNLVTSALEELAVGEARLAGLLTPQGKIMFEFFAVRTAEGFLLDTQRGSVAELIKRLTLYRLRAKVVIADESDRHQVMAMSAAPAMSDGVAFRDPRHDGMGWRAIVREASGEAGEGRAEAYVRRRIDLGVAEGGADYAIAETFPHEANYDRNGGVSFTKGCFIGQEVVARMQNKAVVRRRVVKVFGEGALTRGGAVLHGAGEVGRIGSVDGARGLAMVRLDRALEAHDKGERLVAEGVAITVDAGELDAYRAAVARRPVIDL